MMNWNDYRNRYSAFLASLQQTEMIFYYAAKSLSHTPTKIKEDEKAEVPFLVNYSRQAFERFSSGFRTDHLLLDIDSISQIIFNGRSE